MTDMRGRRTPFLSRHCCARPCAKPDWQPATPGLQAVRPARNAALLMLHDCTLEGAGLRQKHVTTRLAAGNMRRSSLFPIIQAEEGI